MAEDNRLDSIIEKVIATAIDALSWLESTFVGVFFVGWSVGVISIIVLAIIIIEYISMSPVLNFWGTAGQVNSTPSGTIRMNGVGVIDTLIPIPIISSALIAAYVILTTNIKNTWLYGYHLRLRLFKIIFRESIARQRSGGEFATYLTMFLIITNSTLLTLATASYVGRAYPSRIDSMALYLLSSLVIPISYLAYIIYYQKPRKSKSKWSLITGGLLLLTTTAFINVYIVLRNAVSQDIGLKAMATTVSLLMNSLNIAYYYLGTVLNYRTILDDRRPRRTSIYKIMREIYVKRVGVKNNCPTVELEVTATKGEDSEDLLTFLSKAIRRHLRVASDEQKKEDFYKRLAAFLFIVQSNVIARHTKFLTTIRKKRHLREKCMRLAFALIIADTIQQHTYIGKICKKEDKEMVESCLWECFGISPFSQEEEKGFIELPAYLMYPNTCNKRVGEKSVQEVGKHLLRNK